MVPLLRLEGQINMEEDTEVVCPHCGAPHLLFLDLTQNQQSYIEDCTVCCRPMQVTLVAETGKIVSLEVEVA